MRRSEHFFPVFFILIFVSIVLLVLSIGGHLKAVSGFAENIASSIGIKTYSIFKNLPFIADNKEEKKTKDNVISLQGTLAEIERLKKENSALRDQFETTNLTSYDLIPAKIVGLTGFVSNITTPISFVIDKGIKDGIKEGYVAVYKNNVIGKVAKASSHLSKVDIIVKDSSSFAAKTQNGSIGVAKGDGKTITLDNVLLSEDLKVGDIVLTKGDLDMEGIGYSPDLIVGKIVSIDKNPSNLFQKAKVESFVDFNHLSTIFIVFVK